MEGADPQGAALLGHDLLDKPLDEREAWELVAPVDTIKFVGDTKEGGNTMSTSMLFDGRVPARSGSDAAVEWRVAIYDEDGELRGESRVKDTGEAATLLEGFLAQHPEESFAMRVELAASCEGGRSAGGYDAASTKARIKGGSRT
jgi:hypothetical protein